MNKIFNNNCYFCNEQLDCAEVRNSPGFIHYWCTNIICKTKKYTFAKYNDKISSYRFYFTYNKENFIVCSFKKNKKLHQLNITSIWKLIPNQVETILIYEEENFIDLFSEKNPEEIFQRILKLKEFI